VAAAGVVACAAATDGASPSGARTMMAAAKSFLESMNLFPHAVETIGCLPWVGCGARLGKR